MQHTRHTSLALVLATLAVFSATPTAFADNRSEEQEHGRALGRTLVNTIKKDKSEVSITASGAVVLQSATVTAVSGSQLTVTTTLGTSVLTWTITTDSATQFLNRGSKAITATDIVVGDTVNVRGNFTSGSTLSVRATSVRDITKTTVVTPPVVTSNQQIFEGALTVLPGATAPTSLTMIIAGQSQAVAINAATVVLNKDWNTATLGTFQSGDVIRVFGFIPAGSSSVSAIVLRNATR